MSSELLQQMPWQLIGTLLAVVAICVSILIYKAQRHIKRISYEILSKTQLLTVDEELEGKLQVLYAGEPARDICLLIVKLSNSGNQPIPAADYERPISFFTGSSSKILSAVITEVDPKNLPAEIDLQSSSVVLRPLLLNAKDSLTIKLLISDFGGKLVSDGRVAGVKSIQNARQTSGYYTFLIFLYLILMIVGMVLFFSSVPKPEISTPLSFEAKVGLAMFVFSYIGSIYLAVKHGRMGRIMLKVVKSISSYA